MTQDVIEQLFRFHYEKMFLVALRMTGNPQASQDIVHDVFASLLESDRSHVSEAFLMLSVRNRCINLIRDISTRERILGLYALETEEDSDATESATDFREIRKIIDESLGRKCREVVELRFGAGLKYKEIAAELRISETAVYKHLRHAIDKLRNTLNKNG